MPDSKAASKFGPYEVLASYPGTLTNEISIAGPSYLQNPANHDAHDYIFVSEGCGDLNDMDSLRLASLLSAAPELLASVRTLLVHVRRLHAYLRTPESRASVQYEIEAAEFAIAKAQGERKGSRLPPMMVDGDHLPGWQVLSIRGSQAVGRLPADFNIAFDKFVEEEEGAEVNDEEISGSCRIAAHHLDVVTGHEARRAR